MTNYTFKVFPFGKYKGYHIDDLPLTYIVYALEEFELPNDLVADLQDSLVSRLQIPYIDQILVFSVCADLDSKDVWLEINERNSDG